MPRIAQAWAEMKRNWWNLFAFSEQALDPRVRSGLKRSFLAYTGLGMLLGWGYAVWHISEGYDRALESADQQLLATASALAAHMEAVLGDGLGDAEAAFQRLRKTGRDVPQDADAVGEELASSAVGGSYVHALFFSSPSETVIARPDGTWSRVAGPPTWITAEALTEANLTISRPMPDPERPAFLTVAIAKQYSVGDGESRWVGAWLDCHELLTRYAAVRPDRGAVAVLRTDGQLVASTANPERPTPAYIVRRSEIYQQLQKVAKDSLPRVFQGISPLDGKRKLYGVAVAAGGAPMYIIVSREMDAALAVWKARAKDVLGMSIGATFILVLLTQGLSRSIGEVNRREAQFLKLFENSLASILLLKDGHVVEKNSTAARVFRVPPGETLRGLTPEELSADHQPSGEPTLEALEKRRRELRVEGGTTFNWIFKRMDTHEPFEAEVNLSSIQIGPDLVTLAIVRDISEQEFVKRELEAANERLEARVLQRTFQLQDANAQLAASNRELEEFTAAASHDLRSPLGAIAGQAGLLELQYGAALGEKGRERLHKINKWVRHATDVVEGLLSLAKLTRQELRVERVCLSELAQRIIDDFVEAEPDRIVDIHIEPELWVRADARLMQSLLMNLLSNAWKYSSNRLQVCIRFERHRRAQEMVYCVEDRGEGFNLEYAHRLFQAFSRMHTQEQFSGIGLGLAIVARIVARYGGLVWAEAEEGRGARFFFTLPLTEVLLDEETEMALRARAAQRQGLPTKETPAKT